MRAISVMVTSVGRLVALGVFLTRGFLPLEPQPSYAQDQSAPLGVVVMPIEGPAVRATLRRVEPPWTFLVQVEGQEAETPLSGESLFRLSRQPRGARTLESSSISGPCVLLAGGDRLRVRVGGTTDEALQLRSRLFGELAVPWEAVAAIALRGDEGPAVPRRPRNAALNQDVLVLTNGDSVGGTILSMDEQQIELDSTVGEVKIVRSGVASIFFNPDLTHVPEPEGLHALVWLSDGSRVTAVALRSAGNRLVLDTPYRVRLEVDASAVEQVQFFGGPLVYLSDLEPAGFEHTPYFTVRWPFQRDRSVGGNPLRLRGTTYAKGLGLHSDSRLAYDLGARFRRFEATIGIDDETDGVGSVVFRVVVDGKERYASPVVRGTDEPITLEPIDVAGAQTLELLVEHADYGDVQDHSDWVDARLLRAE